MAAKKKPPQAAAAKANAEAITAIANGLKGSPATMEYGINIGGR